MMTTNVDDPPPKYEEVILEKNDARYQENFAYTGSDGIGTPIRDSLPPPPYENIVMNRNNVITRRDSVGSYGTFVSAFLFCFVFNVFGLIFYIIFCPSRFETIALRFGCLGGFSCLVAGICNSLLYLENIPPIIYISFILMEIVCGFCTIYSIFVFVNGKMNQVAG